MAAFSIILQKIYIYPSEVDSLHLTEDGHKILAERVYEIIKKNGF